MRPQPDAGARDARRTDAVRASAPASAPDGEGRPVRRVRVFAIVALALMMMSIDSTIVATALHALQQGLGTSINWAGWTITAYRFGFVPMLPVSGRLSERYGRRRVFIGSVVTFTVASLCCALADDIWLMVALRALQAAGGAGFTPPATGIVVDQFGDARERPGRARVRNAAGRAGCGDDRADDRRRARAAAHRPPAASVARARRSRFVVAGQP